MGSYIADVGWGNQLTSAFQTGNMSYGLPDSKQGDPMNYTHERYVNNELLGFISRPQYDSSCSMSSLTAVINYLFSDQIGIKTTKEWANDINIHSPEENMSPGNRTVMGWFNRVCKSYQLNGSCGYFIQDDDVEDWADNQQVIAKLKKAVNNKNQALIYHLDNHYNLIVGYFDHARKPDDAFNPDAKLERWIVLGEHSDYNFIPDFIMKIIDILPTNILSEDHKNLLKERTGSPPVWCRKWGSIRHDLMNTPNHCIMLFQRH